MVQQRQDRSMVAKHTPFRKPDSADSPESSPPLRLPARKRHGAPGWQKACARAVSLSVSEYKLTLVLPRRFPGSDCLTLSADL